MFPEEKVGQRESFDLLVSVQTWKEPDGHPEQGAENHSGRPGTECRLGQDRGDGSNIKFSF